MQTRDQFGGPAPPALHVSAVRTGAFVPHPLQIAGLVPIPEMRMVTVPRTHYNALANAMLFTGVGPTFTFNGMMPG